MSKMNILFKRWLVKAYGPDHKYVVRNNLPILREAFIAGYETSPDLPEEINALGDPPEKICTTHERDCGKR
jgi:hypothetical protein